MPSIPLMVAPILRRARRRNQANDPLPPSPPAGQPEKQTPRRVLFAILAMVLVPIGVGFLWGPVWGICTAILFPVGFGVLAARAERAA